VLIRGPHGQNGVRGCPRGCTFERDFAHSARKAWMAGTSPAMTIDRG
jgi:hypothetical protein